MTNADIASDLRKLRADLAARRLSIEDVERAFERLTYELRDLRDGDDEELRGFVNDIELIRFTRLPENQQAAVDGVLSKAEELFDELAK